MSNSEAENAAPVSNTDRVTAAIISIAVDCIEKLATDPEVQARVARVCRGVFDVAQVVAGKVNRHDLKQALGIALGTCTKTDDESRARVAAFVTALYAQHDIRRAAQVGGSLRKRFGVAWFPHVHEREERHALNVDRSVEEHFYGDIAKNGTANGN